MADLLYVMRYFQVVPPIPRLLLGSFVVLTVACCVLTALTDDADGASMVPIVVLQAFSTSTGFAVSARRGYFDLLIARGLSRVRIAIAQWLVALVPGLCSWAILASVRSVSHGGHNPLLQSGTGLAFFMASTIQWAANVGLPRFSGAIGWLLLVSLMSAGGVIWPDSVQEVIFPIAIVGGTVGTRAGVLVVALLLSVVGLALALVWVHRTDIRLEAAQ
jgi:hypothetical protein